MLTIEYYYSYLYCYETELLIDEHGVLSLVFWTPRGESSRGGVWLEKEDSMKSRRERKEKGKRE